MTARYFVERMLTVLQDEAAVRWPVPECVRNLNEALLMLAVDRPDAVAVVAEHTLSAGYRQTLPADAMGLIQVECSNEGRRRALRRVDVLQLDAVSPYWRSLPGTREPVHFMYDLREPGVFEVYPPALPGTKVTVVYPRRPGPIAEASTVDSVSGYLPVADQWFNALLHAALYKGYMKDAEFGGNVALATAHLEAYNALVGKQLQSASAVAPRS